MQNFVAGFAKEYSLVKKSYFLLFTLTLAPFLSFFLVGAIFIKGFATDLPITVVDNDNTPLSRSIITALESSPTLKIIQKTTQLQKASIDMQEGKTYAIVIIPKDFMKKTTQKHSPQINAMLNTQYLLVGKIIKSTLLEIVLSKAAEVEFVQNLAIFKNIPKSKNILSPIDLHVQGYFNPERDYFYFLVSALLPSLWQIFIVVATVVSFGMMGKIESETLGTFFQKHYIAKLLGKMFFHTVIFTIWGLIFTLLIYGYFGWKFHGSYALLILGMTLTVTAYQSVGLFFFALTNEFAEALSFSAVYTAPAFAFLGITFPIYAMNGFALFLRNILPISHYIELQISQANYGASMIDDLPKIFTLALFLLIFIPASWLYRKRILG